MGKLSEITTPKFLPKMNQMTEQEYKSVIEYVQDKLVTAAESMILTTTYTDKEDQWSSKHDVEAITKAQISNILHVLCTYESWYKAKGGKLIQEKFNDIGNGRNHQDEWWEAEKHEK